MIVIDASVAVKWYRPEANSDGALEVLVANAPNIRAPDTFAVEVASALVREANIDKAWAPDALTSLTQFQALCENGGLSLVRATPEFLTASANLAINLGHPLKDCLYLALAMKLGCELVTCDARFAAKARGVWDRVRVLGG